MEITSNIKTKAVEEHAARKCEFNILQLVPINTIYLRNAEVKHNAYNVSIREMSRQIKIRKNWTK